MKHRRKNYLPLFYSYYFFSFLLPLYAVYLLVVETTLGSQLYPSLLIAVWAFTVLCLEIPSGILADVWNKKNVLIIGQSAKFLASCIWMISESLPLFILGCILWGIHESFCSGALEALLYEELEQNRKQGDYQKESGRCRFFMAAGITIAFLTGGLLYSINPGLLFSASILTAGISLITTLLLPKQKSAAPHRFSPPARISQTVQSATHILKTTPILVRIMLYAILYVAVIGSIEEYIQLWLVDLQFQGIMFGTLLVTIMLAQMMGTGLSSVITITKKLELLLYGGMLLCGILLICLKIHLYVALTAMHLIFCITGFMETKLEALTQAHIENQRSTILSTTSFLMNAAAILIAIGIGVISETYSLEASFRFLGWVIIACTILLFSLYVGNRKTT